MTIRLPAILESEENPTDWSALEGEEEAVEDSLEEEDEEELEGDKTLLVSENEEENELEQSPEKLANLPEDAEEAEDTIAVRQKSTGEQSLSPVSK